MKKKYIGSTIVLCILTACISTGCSNKNTESTSTAANASTENVSTENVVSNDTSLFYAGADISSIISLEKSGVKFYNTSNEEQDLLTILAKNSANCFRVRIWNDPYDSAGNSYGGGSCDLDNALSIGTRATSLGVPLLVDFHYSDFWADPKKQKEPKAFSSMTYEEKSDAIYEYTYSSLDKMLSSNILISMVQVGNEINNGMCGENSFESSIDLIKSGAKAVRDVSKKYNCDIKIVLHFANPEAQGTYTYYSQTLNAYNVDYDVFASSYYPYWNGSIDNITNLLSVISNKYDKEVLIAETSYPFTFTDSDCFTNSVNSDSLPNLTYDVSAAGQTAFLNDLSTSLKSIGDKCIGYMYWEPAWISVGNDYNSNLSIWEANGSGWASSYAKEYDANDAGKYFGGSSWDNQALFDSTGHPLSSIETFKNSSN